MVRVAIPGKFPSLDGLNLKKWENHPWPFHFQVKSILNKSLGISGLGLEGGFEVGLWWMCWRRWIFFVPFLLLQVTGGTLEHIFSNGSMKVVWPRRKWCFSLHWFECGGIRWFSWISVWNLLRCLTSECPQKIFNTIMHHAWLSNTQALLFSSVADWVNADSSCFLVLYSSSHLPTHLCLLFRTFFLEARIVLVATSVPGDHHTSKAYLGEVWQTLRGFVDLLHGRGWTCASWNRGGGV